MQNATCSFPPCENPPRTKGYCSGHYEQQRSGRPLKALRRRITGATNEERFWLSVTKTDTCWNWDRCLVSGYGRFRPTGEPEVLVHRYAWILAGYALTPNQMLDHVCRNKRCVNPDHLRIADAVQNGQNFSGPTARNKSGYLGVYFKKSIGKWGAGATLYGRFHYAGMFDTPEEANLAAIEIRNRLFTHNDRDRPSKAANISADTTAA